MTEIKNEPVKLLPESAAADWPNVAAYRPPGWRAAWSPAEVGWRWDEYFAAKARGERPTIDPEVLYHVKLLRQAWFTRPEVWRLAELLIGPPEVDPFWNPWSHVHRMYSGVRLLDGVDGRDGFDLSLWGRVTSPTCETAVGRGRTAYVNGPHDDTAAYVALAVRAVCAGHRVAAVVALDGCNWFAGGTAGFGPGEPKVAGLVDVLSCDVLAIPEGGRMSFLPAPGISASSPSKGYALAVWGVLDELFASNDGRGIRVEVDGQRWALIQGCGDAGTVRDNTHVFKT